jgi:uracil-DNA glycosylase family 4
MKEMLDDRQIRLLELLEDQINNCNKCPLLYTRKCLPYWTPLSKYLIIGEAPGANEVGNEPFIGTAGNKLWNIMDKHYFRKEEFAIINSIQCRPVTATGSNGKPKSSHMENCRPWIRKFIRILEPHRVLLLGNYAKSVFEENNPSMGGIMGLNGTYRMNNLYIENLPVVYSVHPSMCIYKGKEGEQLLEKSIIIFKELTI